MRVAATVNTKDCGWEFLRLFNGYVYSGVETLGKELFMYFGPIALRIHFGMKGFISINPGECENRGGVSPTFQVQLTRDLICFFDSSVELRNSTESQQRVRMMEELDVCSPKFSLSRAESEVKQQKDRMLCDVVLDQRVLPGVGNIIKNEALFDSGLHPAVKVCELSEEQTHHLVKMIRDFSILFYRCHKAGSAISKHYKVYKRPNCGQCHCKITVCRLGENSRMTYFCPHCQKENPQHVQLCKLPTRKAVISWTSGREDCLMDSVARKFEEQWSCVVCTLINKPSAEACDACLTVRPVDSVLKNEENNIAASNLVKYPCNNFGNTHTEVKINRKAVFGSTTLVLTDFSNKSSTSARKKSPNQIIGGGFQNFLPTDVCFSDLQHPSKEGANYITQPSNRVNISPTVCAQSKLFSSAHKKLKTAHSSEADPKYYNPGLSNSERQTSTTDGPRSVNAGSPRCKKHNRLCVLRVVRKDGENKGRQFYACPLPREAQCGFFEWADLSFPLCKHGKRSIMRTVLKIGPNNGKNFFVCPLEKEKQCNFFQWAESGPGMEIIPGC
ncbi:endonuclease 8-like 3 isoform X2 [Cricetulus griseus]|uniref:endonuclease 8-like 3 isoform X2 n=1 Tax=Cricetulus griseus TaxID=10029 RepID=UPI00045442EF|nr:endonuclease 8-like 3 isoform X2 [Cricetulus griseus]XP_007641846.1 endonuclease 8-like 3 isoform X2 [Cricetulus griseus]XP_007641847.1 endonuclease 8-like 3 isoform X2 [Cricetulus griseus]XP_016831393.1 endonuclease 8-like 3 isoform X2 [Cricetulus griseus]XP_035312160.1 endonuclease 8-like 3 isoform X2 [Cricetulus griseus]XP_035312161.1 endonuclease 8-like 3 isoform X2 [Cricetulus griseus]